MSKTVRRVVEDYFKGDVLLAIEWWDTKNPELDNYTPRQVMRLDEELLRAYIKDEIEGKYAK